ncbi:hypothetical protein AKJ49_01020 [candidate division MSBL1 archaeon SCGC-AAA382A03]|uniref:Metalloenzyme domain-containing protein n=1 Tax=candidate division MSBL1 archaeon SCGC-AAA382A03 TaxID=1698278 RepID=A0A133VFX1_9EURY|nr:hypothetical protein AKJ49_01020 [candidate division MSBL1 archaeon SCGC-AAA382A03]
MRVMKSIYDQRDVAPTLAKILNVSYDVPSGKPIGINESFISEKLIFAIIDSLDWNIYEKFARKIIKNCLNGSFREFKILSAAKITSPAIATLLTGLNPEEHGVFSTADAENSEILNLPEFAQTQGVNTTVVMEAGGANTFLRTLKSVRPVEDSENVDDFDEKILEGVRASLSKFDFIVCHLRTVDEYLHQGKSLKEVDKGLKKILQKIIDMAQRGEYLLVLTGDHETHGEIAEGNELVPLVLIDFS